MTTVTANALNMMPPFEIAGGTRIAPTGGVEKVTYTSLSDEFAEFLSAGQTSGYLSCTLPISLYNSSSLSSVKIAIGTNNYDPNFSGNEGEDYVTIKGSGEPFLASGMTICLPLSKIVPMPGAVTSLSIVIQNASTSLIRSFSSEAVISVLAQVSVADIPPFTPSDLVIASYLDCSSTGSAGDVGFSNVSAAGYNGPMIFGFGWVGSYGTPSETIPVPLYYLKNCTEAYIASTDQSWDVKAKIIAKVSDARTNGFDKCLLSFGGAAQSFMSGKSNYPGQDFDFTPITSLVGLQTLATNMATLAISLGCNGIDFDFEMDPAAGAYLTFGGGYLPQTGPYAFDSTASTTDQKIVNTKQFVKLLAQNIKTAGETLLGNMDGQPLGTTFYLACAPQVNRSGGNSIFVSAGYYSIFDDALAAGAFDYVFIQYYNTPPEANPTYVQNSWSSLISKLGPNDTNTKFIVGYPSTVGSAVGWPRTPVGGVINSNNIFCYDGSAPDAGSQTKTLTTYDGVVNLQTTLLTMKNDPVTYPNFGGVFNWSLNREFSTYYIDNNQEPTGAPGTQNPLVWTNPGTWGATMKTVLEL